MEIALQGIRSRIGSYGQRSVVISYLFCALVLITPFVCPSKYYDFTVAPKEALYQIGTIGILSLILWNGCRPKIPAAFHYTLIFTAYCATTMAWAINPYKGFSVVLHWFVCSLAIIITANSVNKSHLLIAIFLSGIGVAIIGLLQKYYYYYGFDYFVDVIKPGSTFANRNFAAHYVTVCLIVAFLLARKNRLYFLPSAIMVWFIVICRTRAAGVAFAVSAFFILAKRKHFLIGLIALTVFAGALSWKSPSRVEYYSNTLSMIADNPLGVGIGNFNIMYPIYNLKSKIRPNSIERMLEFSHNDYLQTVAETGIAGLLIMICFMIGVAKSIHLDENAAPIICIMVLSCLSFPTRLPCIPFVGGCLIGSLSK